MTKRQAQILAFIDCFIRRNGYSPSYRELAESIGHKTSATAHHAVSTLQELGFIHSPAARHRAIEIVKPVPAALAHPSPCELCVKT